MYSAIKCLRKKFSIKQKDLADRLNITRQSLTKYETDPSTLNVSVLKKLTMIFGVDYATIIDNKIIPDDKDNQIDESLLDGQVIVPEYVVAEDETFLINKFTQIILYITNEIGARPNFSRLSLVKMLFLIETDYYKIHKESLFNVSFIKYNYGPCPKDFDKIIDLMEKSKLLETYSSPYFSKVCVKYIPTCTATLDTLTSDELQFINKEIYKYCEFNNDKLDKYLDSIPYYVNGSVGSVISFIDSDD